VWEAFLVSDITFFLIASLNASDLTAVHSDGRRSHDAELPTTAEERRRPVITGPGMKHEAVAPVQHSS
jgi:hypothetical protein